VSGIFKMLLKIVFCSLLFIIFLGTQRILAPSPAQAPPAPALTSAYLLTLPNGMEVNQDEWIRFHIETFRRQCNFDEAKIFFLCSKASYITLAAVEHLTVVEGQPSKALEILEGLYDNLQQMHRLGPYSTAVPDAAYSTAVPDAAASSSTPASADWLLGDGIDGTLRDMSADVKEGEKLLNSVSGGKRQNPHTNVMDEDKSDD